MNRKATVFIASSLVASSVLSLGQVAQAAQKKSEVSNLNVRTTPSLKGKVLTRLQKGAVVSVLSVKGAWTYVSFGKMKGYVYSKYLTSVTTVKKPHKSHTKQEVKGTVQAEWLTVRQTDSASAKAIDYLKKGKIVTIVEKAGSWYKVKYDQKTGYVNGSYIKLVGVTTPPPPPPKPDVPPKPTPPKSLAGKIIVIDPGHGNQRPGSMGNGLVEKNLNWTVSQKVQAYLNREGAEVILTRDGDSDCEGNGSLDADLRCRADVAKDNHADAFISIHTNSASSNAMGAESFYYQGTSSSLAEAVLNSYVAETGLIKRRANFGNLAVLRYNTVPSTLLELGFLSNPLEATTMKTAVFQDQAARGIVKGIQVYFGK
ncbi:N-acetylmuramoyl-L-alanine amidase [Fictibacillus macauensis ZFHKF-1]|uniref:N-acetylmuramoyl-L-alanine amidase n=1 Tax=Fictibacillus macauensis ZFHKF-1 TaxID=1196324 RepID=I8J3B9_9BACL|nr:N-acetylmuramoyl-L-alanine amidase [Fictibacillus macauensis]EIT86261.1 N-acetylmuramoyl-L-alanine amidase [Fictibacillus macauensis ZFHKF-1]